MAAKGERAAIHYDGGGILAENVALLPPALAPHLERIAQISAALRKERELSFYGDEDFLPSQRYALADGQRCLTDVDWLLGIVQSVFERKS